MNIRKLKIKKNKYVYLLVMSLLISLLVIVNSPEAYAADPEILINYNFDDENANDSSVNSNNGIINGSVTYADHDGGKAILLDGNGWIELPSSLVYNNHQFTVEVSFNTTSTQVGIFGYQNTLVNGSPDAFVPIISIDENGKLYTEMYTTTQMVVSSLNTVNDGQWHRVTLTSDNSSIHVYLDGQSLGSQSGSVNHYNMTYNQIGTNAAWSRPTYFNLSTYQWTPYTGMLDDFVFYPMAKTGEEIAKTTQTISFDEIANKSVGDSSFELTATASSGLDVTYSSSDTSVATISGSTVTIVGAGTANITANQAGNDAYSAAASVTRSLTVEEEALSNDASLSGVSLSAGTLTPVFDSGTTSYTASVGNGVTSIRVTPTVNDANASVKVNGVVVASGSESGSINLNVGTNNISLVATAEDDLTEKTYVIRVSRQESISTQQPISSQQPSSTQQPTYEGGITVVINGEEQTAGDEEIETEDGAVSVSLDINEEVVEQKIKELKQDGGNVVSVLVGQSDADNIMTALTGDLVETMEQALFTLIINTDDVDYVIPANEIDIKEVARVLGVADDELQSIEINIEINRINDIEISAAIEESLKDISTMLFPPVEFKIIAKVEGNGGTRTHEIDQFSSFVERIIELPENVDPSKITTGIVYNADGSISHVPTVVFEQNGIWYAKINSLTNSVYSVIWNDEVIKNVIGHWSEESVNDMASRLVIEVDSEFLPDMMITRQVFIKYVVKALGLYRGESDVNVPFIDKNSQNNYLDYISVGYQYGLITGYNDGSFKGEEFISREEAMAILARAMVITKLIPEENGKLNQFVDSDSVSMWSTDYVNDVVNADIFTGYNNMLMLHKPLTYAEAIQAIRNLLIRADLIND